MVTIPADILEAGSAAWNAWRRESGVTHVDLSGLQLRRRKLNEADFSNCDLRDADLTRAELNHANLTGADLDGASLRGAYLSRATLVRTTLRRVNAAGAEFETANLRYADLSHANLASVDFTRADLYAADLTKAHLVNTQFLATNMPRVVGLDKARYHGPSHVDFATLARSPKLPLQFLRGCGLFDWQIEVSKLSETSLTSAEITDILYRVHELRAERPLQFYSCFISYSSADEALARLLFDNLQSHGVRCWYAPEHLKIGDRFRPAIHDAIRLHDRLLLLISHESIASHWVDDEVERAFEIERQQARSVLFPIRVDNAVMTAESGWAVTLRNGRHIGDFRNWHSPTVFADAFARLLRDLRAEGVARPNEFSQDPGG